MRRRDFIIFLAGAMAACPLAARAQQKPMPVIGFLGLTTPASATPAVAGFRQGLSETGFVEGRNVAIEYRWAEARYERLPVLAADLVSRKIDLLLATGPQGPRAARNATATVPIVFVYGGDPVADGLVPSLARPGSNLTGVAIQVVELLPKRLELLSELAPHAKVIALLVNPTEIGAIGQVQAAAHTKGLELPIFNAATKPEIDTAFATLADRHVDALIIGGDAFFTGQREQLITLASRYAVPVIDRWPEFAISGGLISYGPSLTAAYRQAGIYAGKILNGAKPADLPIQQPTKFELVINLKTAQALGLTVPQSILIRADQVIE